VSNVSSDLLRANLLQREQAAPCPEPKAAPRWSGIQQVKRRCAIASESLPVWPLGPKILSTFRHALLNEPHDKYGNGHLSNDLGGVAIRCNKRVGVNSCRLVA